MRLLFDKEIYDDFTQSYLVSAKNFVWIATANIKGTSIRVRGKFISFVDIMSSLVNQGVSFRIIHADIPSGPFRERYEQLDTKGRLSAGVEFLHCIRMHAKIFIIDGIVGLVGSSNLTGAGIGAKAGNNRNFEAAFLLDQKNEIAPFMEYFDLVWMGAHCPHCGRREICPAPPA